ncbi:hypothetical protein QJS10_CPA03g01466 [Acorus calamus]|uniref:Uncharacterized protein n=1 Tax=Acorus calamus TaxID=4465 RepID=A0AAV9F8C0_ACOCL|nr:hypothetical protein QJS10_CPA03g01466 [Acorus calamus]
MGKKLTYLRRSEQQRKRDESKQVRIIKATIRHFGEDEGVGSERRTKGHNSSVWDENIYSGDKSRQYQMGLVSVGEGGAAVDDAGELSVHGDEGVGVVTQGTIHH